ncbi:hypothetical protein HN51_058959 [Arachis hypogaea]
MSLVLGFGLKWLLLVMRRWSLLWVFLVFRQVLLLRFVLFVSKFMVHAHNVASVLLISMPCVHLGLATEWRSDQLWAPNPDTILIMQTPLGVISTKNYEELGHDGNRTVANGVDKEGPVLSKLCSSSTTELHHKNGAQGESKPTNMPPTSVMTRLILIMVWRKLIRNPNTYSSLIGLTWSLISFNLPHEHLRFIPTYTNTGPSPRVDVNNNQLQQGEQDDLEVRVEKIIYRCRFLATFGVFGYLIVEINRESVDRGQA